MAISEGQRWSLKLARDLKRIANSIRIYRRGLGSVCPGGKDPLSGEFDPKIDRAYHETHPSAPVCVAGLIGAAPVASSVLGFHLPNLKDAELEYLSIGELNSNQAVAIFASDQDVRLTVQYEFPKDSGVLWKVLEGYPRSMELNNYRMFFYIVAEKE